MATEAEITNFCVDTTSFLTGNHPYIKAQVEAIKLYCEVKLRCNSENRVGIVRMAGGEEGVEVFPTSYLQKILRYVEGLPSRVYGVVNFPDVIGRVLGCDIWTPSNLKRRLLVFAGSPLWLPSEDIFTLGSLLKKMDIALTVVNFFVLEEDMLRLYYEKLDKKFQYGRREFAELVAIVNANDNSHMVDIDIGESSVCDILSKLLLKKNIRYLRKKDEEKANKNVNVKQELEPSRNEKNKTAAEYCKQLPSSRLICKKVSGSVPKKNSRCTVKELQKNVVSQKE